MDRCTGETGQELYRRRKNYSSINGEDNLTKHWWNPACIIALIEGAGEWMCEWAEKVGQQQDLPRGSGSRWGGGCKGGQGTRAVGKTGHGRADEGWGGGGLRAPAGLEENGNDGKGKVNVGQTDEGESEARRDWGEQMPLPDVMGNAVLHD